MVKVGIILRKLSLRRTSSSRRSSSKKKTDRFAKMEISIMFYYVHHSYHHDITITI